MKKNKRDYGNDSILSHDLKFTNKPIGLKLRLAYYFDNAISKTPNFIIFLVLLSMFIGLLMMLLGYVIDPPEKKDALNDWWDSFTSVLGVGHGANWSDRFLTFLYWCFGVAISGTVIGFITTGISGLVKELKRGRSQVILHNHILILGWTNNIFTVISELSIANKSSRNAKLVIFSKLENQFMQDQIKQHFGSGLDIEIITRSGDIGDPQDLALVNPANAKNIIVLGYGESEDSTVILSTLSLYPYVKNRKITIIVQLVKRESEELFSRLSDLSILPVFVQTVINNVTTQALRQRGIGAVILDFLDFQGNEIYFFASEHLAGKTYADAIMSFRSCAVFGIVTYEGITLLNPDPNTVLNRNDKLVLVAEDDSDIEYNGQVQTKHSAPILRRNSTISRKNLLVIGWSELASNVLDKYMNFERNNSSVFIVYDGRKLNSPDQVDTLATVYGHVAIDMSKNSINIPDFIREKKISDVLVIAYTDKHSIVQSDAYTLVTMMELNAINRTTANQPLRVIAQLLDSSKSVLARFTETEELIISDNLTALLIAQYTENPHLRHVFDDLFNSEGATINVYPASDYAELPCEIEFGELVRTGIGLGQSVIGISFQSSGNHTDGVEINIPKDRRLKLGPNDFVISID
jgi:Trk K+ transport system NAD-binding subunit